MTRLLIGSLGAVTVVGLLAAGIGFSSGAGPGTGLRAVLAQAHTDENQPGSEMADEDDCSLSHGPSTPSLRCTQ